MGNPIIILSPVDLLIGARLVRFKIIKKCTAYSSYFKNTLSALSGVASISCSQAQRIGVWSVRATALIT